MNSYQKFRSDNRKPEMALPLLSCDSQIHVFGDPLRYPIRPESSYKPHADATIDAALAMHQTLGIGRGVIVQATVHGTDHRILFDALERAGPAYRGVAIVNDTVSDRELRRLHDAGVRGARFNFWKQLNIAPSADEFRRSIHRIRDYGWLAKIHAAGEEWLELETLLREGDVPVVIDHLGHVDLAGGLDQPVFRIFRQLLELGNWWIMVSNSDRYSTQERGWDDAAAFVRSVIELAPERTIWCSDWPHVQYRKPMPSDTELIELLFRATPSVELRRKVLSENPARLFGFP
jgi:predicted TIM-barrel fold metal-dependent hydrolase